MEVAVNMMVAVILQFYKYINLLCTLNLHKVKCQLLVYLNNAEKII